MEDKYGWIAFLCVILFEVLFLFYSWNYVVSPLFGFKRISAGDALILLVLFKIINGK